MKSRRWITLNLLLIIVGVAFVIINNAVYVPRIAAFSQAWTAWSPGNADTVQPSPELYGLDTTAFYVSTVFGNAGIAFVLIGACYFGIVFIAKIARSYGYAKEPQ